MKNKSQKKVFIIAEAGVNHNGSLKTAKKMVDVAVASGVDAIKFQTFHAEDMVLKSAPKAKYQQLKTSVNESQFAMIKKLELDSKAHQELSNYCRRKKIMFLSSPFDLKSIDILHQLGLTTIKIPSGEITNLPYLRKLGRLRKKIIFSTGMSNVDEVKAAFEVLVSSGTPKKDITLLHCNTEYPTPYPDVNLLAMVTLKNVFGVNVGYSDHTSGIEVAIAAVALGATVIEKHFTLDRRMKGPDHGASLEPYELKRMVDAIRNVELSLGSDVKKVSLSEQKNKNIVRKSIVAAKDIKKGEIFSELNLTVKRPGKGISPMAWDRIVGSVAKQNYREDDFIKENHS